MPIAVKRGIIEDTAIDNNFTDEEIANDTEDCVDVNGLHYTLPFYNVYVFKKEIPVILFYLKDGFVSAMDFLGVSGAINLVEKIPTNDNGHNLYFEISRNRCYIQVNKVLFHKHPYLQSIVGGILHVSTVRNTIDTFEKPEVWIKKLSGTNNLEKGYDILNFFGRLLDKKNCSIKTSLIAGNSL